MIKKDFFNLSSQEQIEFDFTDETIMKLRLKSETKAEYQNKSSFEKYIQYREYSNQKRKIDPDSNSDLIQIIYKALWNDQFSKEYVKADDERAGSDAVTSAQDRLKQYILFLKDYQLSNESGKTWKKFSDDYKFGDNLIKETYDKQKEFKNTIDKSKALNGFLNAYHTIGNYCVVPKGFNRAKGHEFAKYDYVDLMLMKIKEYYDKKESHENDREPIRKLLGVKSNNEIVNNCCNWLDDYKDWTNFIEKNYFQDYVDTEGKVIPLFKNHSWDQPNILDKTKNKKVQEKAFNDFFTNAKEKIYKRGERIIEDFNNRECK